jgi:hypothetical protein
LIPTAKAFGPALALMLSDRSGKGGPIYQR